MKYADGPTVEVEIHIHAPPSAVWPLICDVDLPARFSSEFQGAEWIDEDGPKLGARFKGRNKHPRVGEWETTSHIVGFEAERLFAWNVADPQRPAASWKFELEPDGDGTRVRQWVRLGPAPSGLTMAIEAMPEREERIIERRCEEHRQNMTATLEGIKALAEQR